MRSQESLELNNRINNIKALIERKHPPVDSLHFNYREMMKQLQDKSHYLSKRSPTIEKLRQLPNDDEGQWQRQHLMNESRQKIRNFDNELEKLDKLLKMKNKLRAQKVKREEEQRKMRILQAMSEQKKEDVVTRKQLQSIKISEVSKSRAVLGDGIPNSSILSGQPLHNLKPQKFIELYRQYLRRHKADPKCKFRFLGMGLQNTPYYHSMMANRKNREIQLIPSSASPEPSPKRSRMVLKTTMDSVYAQSPILFSQESINIRPNCTTFPKRSIRESTAADKNGLNRTGKVAVSCRKTTRLMYKFIVSVMKATSLTSTAASNHLTHVKKFGQLTEQTRKPIYIQCLQLPLNYRHFTELNKGPVRSLPEHSNERQLTQVVAALTKHYPDLRIQWLPGIIYPWIKLFPKDPLAQFQISLSFLANWYGPILRSYPSPSKELMNCIGQQLPQTQKKLKDLGQGMGQLVWPSFLVSLTDILNKTDWLKVFDWLMLQPQYPELLLSFYIQLLKYLEPQILACANIQQMHKILRKQRGIQMKKLMEFAQQSARNNPSLRQVYDGIGRWPLPKGRYPVHHFLSRNLELMEEISSHQKKQQDKLQQEVEGLEQQLRRKNAELRGCNQQNMTQYADKLDQALREHLRTVSENNQRKLSALRQVQHQLRQWLHGNQDFRRQQSDTISDYVQRRAMLERAIQQSKEETRVTHQLQVDALHRLKSVLNQKERQQREKLQRLHEQLHRK